MYLLNVAWKVSHFAIPRDKRKNINGLQLADLAAYPIARYVNDKERANPSFDIIKPKIYSKGTKLYGLKEFP